MSALLILLDDGTSLDGLAAMGAPALSLSSSSGLAGVGSSPAPAFGASVPAAPLEALATSARAETAVSSSAWLAATGALVAPAFATEQGAPSIAAAAGIQARLALVCPASLDGGAVLSEPRQALRWGIVRRAALGSQQRRPWRIYDGEQWTEHRPRQFNGITF